jgi:peptidoglycan/LPS O-acetylase OafA/YrhL
MKEKIHCLDGLRGLAAFVVLLHHFILAFYPRFQFTEPIYFTPFNLFYNGGFSVSIFFVLSGYVLSYKFFQSKDLNILAASATKRYFRLLLPVLGSVTLAYFLLKFGLFTNVEASKNIVSGTWFPLFYNFEADFIDMLKQGLYTVFLHEIPSTISYNATLWTMRIEFFGSLLTFSFLALFGKLNKRFLVYIILFIVLYKTYYLAFLFGVILSDISNSQFKQKFYINNKPLLLIIFLISLFLGSYPLGETNNTMYKFLNFSFLKDYFLPLYQNVGGGLLLYVVLSSSLAQTLFQKKIMLFLGKISFSLYVFHFIILCSFSSSFFIFLSHYFSFKLSFIVTFLCSLILILFISYLSYKFLDLVGIKLGNKAYLFLKESSTKNIYPSKQKIS